MTTPASNATRQFATDVVVQLRAAGHEALWAGGCVRDQLLGLAPKDYDVATDATPDRIREIFGHRRTLAIGAAFGVITVLGPKPAGQLDVATFRRDAAYSDGRHPDSVEFTGAREDAQRRDFTINGLFYDPIQDEVIDYVGGREDLQRRIVRAIGDPRQRIAEDKLRMLRAIRFAATFDFVLDPATLAAIQSQAHELTVVSAERIAAEMRRMLVHPCRASAVQMLYDAGLLTVILPEIAALRPTPENQPWTQTLAILQALQSPTFSMSLAALLRAIPAVEDASQPLASLIGSRWKLANDELAGVVRLLRDDPLIRRAKHLPWPRLQRILVAEGAAELLGYSQAVAEVVDRDSSHIDFCWQQLALPREELNPPRLITGNDLKPLGIQPGPAFREILEAIRDAQLEKRIGTKDEALQFARSRLG